MPMLSLFICKIKQMPHYLIIVQHVIYMKSTLKSPLKCTLMLVLLFSLSTSYTTSNNKKEINAFYEEHSFCPILHIYYDRHFHNSRQFDDFMEVIQETEWRNGDFSKILMTDCQKAKTEDLYPCEDMRRHKDNRAIVGFYPSNEFITFGKKIMQNPPSNKRFTHPSDQYAVSQMQNYIQQMMPNFYRQISNLNQFQEFLQPRYSPKLIFLTRQEEVPLVLKKIAVHFMLRFDMAIVEDLTQNVVKQLDIKKFPTLLVYRYNFELQTYEKIIYPSTDFGGTQYGEIKEFLLPYALKTPRNDYIFHKVAMKSAAEIITVETEGELKKALDRADGWTVVSQINALPSKLIQLKDRYGRYLDYVHVQSQSNGQTSQKQEKLSMYHPTTKQRLPLRSNTLLFNAMDRQSFLSNVTGWVHKDYVVVGVREKYAQICALGDSVLMQSLVMCFILKEDHVQEVATYLKVKFDIGFVMQLRLQNGTRQVKGLQFDQTGYEQTYRTLQYQTRLKVKDVVDRFMENPIEPVYESTRLRDLCNYPAKKCALVFIDSKKKDQTNKEYIALAARNFLNEYHFFEVDINCNQEFLDQIEHIRHGGLVVYHPRSQYFVTLKARISRATVDKFLRINTSQSKKLPEHKFSNGDITVNVCASATPIRSSQDPIQL